MKLIKAESIKLNQMFDNEWNQLLTVIAKDMSISEFQKEAEAIKRMDPTSEKNISGVFSGNSMI